MKQPVMFKGLLGALTAGQALGAVPKQLDPDKLEAAARKRTKLDDFGDPYYRKGLEILCNSLNTEGNLNAYGFVLARDLITNSLAARLALQDLRNRNAPELQAELIPPIIVTGLARTGTTALHRMLAAAPGHRGVEWWELLSPVPYADGDVEKRIGFAKKTIAPRKIFTPHLDAAHYIREDTLEECFWMMGSSMASRALVEVLPCPSYLQYGLNDADLDKKYADYADQLRVLQSRRPNERLVMKSPEHLEGIDALARALPTAHLVVTHRPPVDCIPSYASISSLVHSLGIKEATPHKLGAEWLANGARQHELHAERRKPHEGRIYDHQYQAMIDDPINSVKKAFDAFGLEWNDAVAETVAKHTRENQQHKYGKHSYHMSDFGLTADQINDRFANYNAQFAKA